MWKKNNNLHIWLSDNNHLGWLGFKQSRQCTRHIYLLLLDLPTVQVLQVLLMPPSECEKRAVWKAHAQRSTSHYTMTVCHSELKLKRKRKQTSGEKIVNATELRFTTSKTCRWQEVAGIRLTGSQKKTSKKDFHLCYFHSTTGQLLSKQRLYNLWTIFVAWYDLAEAA